MAKNWFIQFLSLLSMRTLPFQPGTSERRLLSDDRSPNLHEADRRERPDLHPRDGLWAAVFTAGVLLRYRLGSERRCEFAADCCAQDAADKNKLLPPNPSICTSPVSNMCHFRFRISHPNSRKLTSDLPPFFRAPSSSPARTAEWTSRKSLWRTRKPSSRSVPLVVLFRTLSQDGSCLNCVLASGAALSANNEAALCEGKLALQEPVDIFKGLGMEQAIRVAMGIGFEGKQADEAADYIMKMYKLFIERDATLLEINPIAEDNKGQGERSFWSLFWNSFFLFLKFASRLCALTILFHFHLSTNQVLTSSVWKSGILW